MPLHLLSRSDATCRSGCLRDRLGNDVWDRLVEKAPLATAPPGQHVGGDGGDVIAVVDGVCRVFFRGPSGRQLTLRYAHGGEAVGLVSVLSDWTSYDAEAVTPVTYVTVPAERVRSLMDTDPAFLRTVAEEVSSYAADAIHMLLNTSFESMSARVAGHLLELATDTDDKGRPVAHVTHQRLAESTGTAREVVTRVLRRFRTAGAIRTGPATIVILDEQRLIDAARADQSVTAN